MANFLESPTAHSGIKRQGSRQRVTMIESEGNPMGMSAQIGDDIEKESVVKVESLTDAKQISASEFEKFLKQINNIEDNAELLLNIELLKLPYLFASTNLLKILEVTPSVKTRLSIISAIGPRLSDPTAKSDELVGLFRYSHDQASVTEVLKQRQHTLQASKFKQTSTLSRPSSSSVMAARGGGAGRGAGRQSLLRVDTNLEHITSKDTGSSHSLDKTTNSSVSSSHECVEDNTTDMEQSSEKSDGSPSDFAEEHVAPTEPIQPEKRKMSTFVVKSRRVTIKTAAELQEEKLAAAAALLHEPNVVSTLASTQMAANTGNSNRSKSVVMAFGAAGGTRPSDATGGIRRGSVTSLVTSVESATASIVPIENAAISTRKIMNSKGWMKGNETMQKISSNNSSGSLPSAPSANSVARVLFSPLDTNSDELLVKGEEIKVSEHLPGGSTAAECTVNVREFVRRNSGNSGLNGVGIAEDGKKHTLIKSFSDRLDIESAALLKLEKGGEPIPGPMSALPPMRRSTYVQETPRNHSYQSSFSAPPDAVVTGSTIRVSELTKVYLSSGIKPSGQPASFGSGGAATPAPVQRSMSVLCTPAFTGQRRRTSSSDVSLIHSSNNNNVPMTTSKPSNAVVAGLDPKYLSSLPAADPITFNDSGTPLYSYVELVRRNYLKSYGDLVQTELERYLTDDEFIEKIGLSREDFYNLPKWKQVSQKKALLLF